MVMHKAALRCLLTFVALLQALGTGACSLNPERDDARAYAAAMAPVLADNTAMAEALLALAADIKKREVEDPALLERWANEVAPLARRMHTAAAAIHPQTPVLAQSHGALLAAWAERAAAFEAVQAAAQAGEGAPLTAALERRVSSAKAEKAAVEAINAALEPHALELDLYPPRTGAVTATP